MRIYLSFTVIIFITNFISVNLAKIENKKNGLNITTIEHNMAKSFTPIQKNIIEAGHVKNDGTVKKLEKIRQLGSDVGRRIRKHFGGLFGPFGMMGGGYGFHALAILYWLKVKAVIISFIIGTAIVWGAKYVWGSRSCPKEIIHEGPIMPFSHGPIWSGHDHIPYSSSYASSPYDHHDHHHISSDSFGSSPFLESSPPSSISGAEHFASEKKWKRDSRQSRQFESEEQISNIAFAFLGVDSDACRKRFVCEWEFRSKRSPITSLLFRVLGRGIFTKYLRNSNEIQSFDDCGMVYDECRFIEEHVPEKEYEDSQEDVNNIVEHSHNDENSVLSSLQENDESTNENETETSTQQIQNDNENKEQYHFNNDIVKNDNNKLDSNKVRKSQPEVKLSMNNYENSQKKKKNIIAETLFNRSKSKLRVVPIRS